MILLQIAAILAIFYVLMIIYDFYESEKRWEETWRDSEEEK